MTGRADGVPTAAASAPDKRREPTYRALVVDHGDLSGVHLDALRVLFDGEYRATHGDWDPDRPYEYSPADVHAMLFHGSMLVGHVGFQRRRVAVGTTEVCVAGTGGVLVHPVVSFYESTGWSRVHATERHVSMVAPGGTIASSDGPILIFDASGSRWPPGEIDLRGTPW